MRYFFALIIMFLLVGVMIQIHELGHALATIAFGEQVQYINIGIRVFPYLKVSIGSLPVYLSPWLIGGGTGVTEETLSSLAYSKQIVIFLTGPVMNALAVIGAYLLMQVFVPEIRGMPLKIFIKGARRFISKAAKIKSSGLTGPVGIIDIGIRVIMNGGLVGVLAIWVSINTSLAVLNLLPIHPLDGGRILIVLLKVALGGGKIAASVISALQFSMFTFAVLAFAYIMVGDIFNRK